MVEIFCRRPASDLYDDDVEILKKSFKYKKKIPLSKLICYDELFKVNKAIKNRISYEEIIFGNVLGSSGSAFNTFNEKIKSLFSSVAWK